MSIIVKFNSVEKFIIELRNEKVILDNNVAVLYGVETKEVNQAVRTNPAKFPDGYVFEVDKREMEVLRSKNLTTISPMSRVMFTAEEVARLKDL